MSVVIIDSANIETTTDTLADLIDGIINKGDRAEITVIKEKQSTGKWGMSRLWRAWMITVSAFMAANGVTQYLMIGADGRPYGTRPFDENDAHALFTKRFLGVDSNGVRLSWAKKEVDGKKIADVGQRFNAMRQLHDWATDKGIELFNPVCSEYQELINRQCQ